MSYLVCIPQILILLEVHFAFSQIPNCYITAAKRDSSAARRSGVGRGGCKGRTGARSRDFENSLFGLTQYVIIMRRDQQPFKHQTHLLFSHQFALFLQICPFLSAVPLYGLIYSISLLPSLLTSQFFVISIGLDLFFSPNYLLPLSETLLASCRVLRIHSQLHYNFFSIHYGQLLEVYNTKKQALKPSLGVNGLEKKGIVKRIRHLMFLCDLCNSEIKSHFTMEGQQSRK